MAPPRNQRGYVLITAIVLSVLYFGLIQLMLMESSRELAEARRFRARMVALTLAENGAELAAVRLMTSTGGAVMPVTSDLGTMSGELLIARIPNSAEATFRIVGRGEASGTVRQKATVELRGRIEKDGRIVIEWSDHSR